MGCGAGEEEETPAEMASVVGRRQRQQQGLQRCRRVNWRASAVMCQLQCWEVAVTDAAVASALGLAGQHCTA